MKTNQDYKNAALAALKGNWAQAVICTIVLVLIALACNLGSVLTSLFGDSNTPGLTLLIIGYVCLLLVYVPLSLGFYNSFKTLLETGDNRLTDNMFSLGFKNWLRNTGGMLLMCLYVILWAFLFYIPAFIMSYAYMMTPFILADRPDLSVNQAIKESKRMMKGHKFDLFCLQLSFAGWYILAILTAGIGLFWLTPYITAATAEFYRDLKSEKALEKTELV